LPFVLTNLEVKENYFLNDEDELNGDERKIKNVYSDK
jgi:hypothetical protein